MERQTHQKISIYKRILNSFSKINVFEEKESLSLIDQFLATRIFIIFLTISLLILVLYTSFNPQTQTVTIYSPSQIIVEKLSHQYPNTLSCPCSQTSIRHDQFLSFHPQYHPICQSDFINQTFLSSLSNPYISEYYRIDFRLVAVSYFQILASLCRTTKQSVENALHKFENAQIITNRVLSHDIFNATIISLVEQLKTTTMADVKQMSQFLSLIITQNRIFTALRTNYFIRVKRNTLDNVLVNTAIPGYSTINSSCFCIDNRPCTYQAGFYNITPRSVLHQVTGLTLTAASRFLIFPLTGVMAGCMPYDSLLQSTLQCFYNQSCLRQMDIYIAQLSTISSFPLSSRFDQTTSVNDLLDDLFIESWNETSNFSGYFHACAPHSCTYSYDRRFNLLYIFITFISYLGGLKLLFQFLSPLLVKLIRRIQKIKCFCCCKTVQKTTQTNEEEQQQQQQSIKDRLLSKIRGLYRRLIVLNLFPTSSTVEDGIYSTRVYLLLLIIGTVVLVFYTSISFRVRNVTVYYPSIHEFEQLNDQYSSTLVCPCSQLSISYSFIIDIKPIYHQVCSSDFTNHSIWFSYFKDLDVSFLIADFRLTGSALFNLLGVLCEMANETVTNQLAVFNGIQFVSGGALTRSTFDAQTFQLIDQFQQQTITSFLGLFELVRASVQLNQFIVRGYSNARLNILWDMIQPTVVFASQTQWTETCSCGTNNSCTRPQGFYYRVLSDSSSLDQIRQTIPGLVLSCLQVDSLLLSTFECFYNSSCIQMLIDWRSFDFPNATDNPWSNIVPLNPMSKSRYLPNTTFRTIVSQLFIEDWISSSNFVSYYNQCLPKECTYSFTQRYDTNYVISTMFSFIGGLSVVLRLFVPPLIQLLRRLYLYYKRHHRQVIDQTHEQSSIRHKIWMIIAYTRRSIVTMNVYKISTKTQTTEQQQQPPTVNETNMLHNQQIATRLYFLLFIYSLFTILLFTALDFQLHSVTVKSPSESRFEQLHSQYSSTLSCPCSQVSIQYSHFVSVIPSAYHQICSSYFISSDFISQLWGLELPVSYRTQLDLKLLSTYFRFLSSFCSLAKDEIEQKIKIFNSSEFMSIEILTRSSFQSQIDSIIQTFIDQTPVIFRQRHQYIIDTFHANQLHTMFLTNWNFSFSLAEQNQILSTSPRVYDDINGSCSCATSSTCSRQLLFNFNTQIITLPGLVGGCLPIHGLRLSTLECFYNLSCVTELFLFTNISSISSSPVLNITSPTRFTPISTILIGGLIDELFVERWQSLSNYSNYYSKCAPSTCRYTYIKRTDVIYMITTFLGLYGGLTIGLKFLVWYGLCIYRKLCSYLGSRRYRVEPMNDN